MNYGLFSGTTDAGVPEASEQYHTLLAFTKKSDVIPQTQLNCLRKAIHISDTFEYAHPDIQNTPSSQAISNLAQEALRNTTFVPNRETMELYNTFCKSPTRLTAKEAAQFHSRLIRNDLLQRAGASWSSFLSTTDMQATLKVDQPPKCFSTLSPITMEERRLALSKYPKLRSALRPVPIQTPSPLPNTSTQPASQLVKNLPWLARKPEIPTAAAPASQTGGFITASDQYSLDVQSGKIPANRPPAMGLKRSNTASVDNVLAATHKSNTQKKKDDGAEEDHPVPPCLLLEDGTIDPRLEGLEPKLLAQVAMEILDSKGTGTDWSDIAGLEHAKSSVEEAIVWPLQNPHLFTGLRDPPRGLLLFGPPGTGKTMIARAIASRAGCTFMNISASSLMSKWVGEGEKLVRCMFAVACVKQPTVVFIDEIDSLLSMRSEGEMDAVRRVKTEFLVQMDGVGTNSNDRVLLIGATNRPEELDEAARRRMEKRLYIPLPDLHSRTELLRRLLNTHRNSLTDSDFEMLGTDTEGYSGADIKGLAREAAMGPVRTLKAGSIGISNVSAEDIRPVSAKDCKVALKRIKPSVGSAELIRYEKWNDQYGSFPLNVTELTQEDE